MNGQITVYFNEHPDHWFGYESGHPIREVFAYDTPLFTHKASEELAEHAFVMFNAPPESLRDTTCRDIAARYRAAGNRSLSIGDVLRVGQTWLACSSGWVPLDVPPTVLAGIGVAQINHEINQMRGRDDGAAPA